MDAMINRILGEQKKNPRLMNPLVLAYIGDTVYDLYVRSWLIEGSDAAPHGLHMMAAGKVCAKAQAAGAMAIMDRLTEEELYIFKRGRNSHMGTVPKHAEMRDYRAASGLEALLGYLFLSGEDGRVRELMDGIKQCLFTEDEDKNEDEDKEK